MTFFDLLGFWGGVEGAAGDAGPATGTHLSTLAIELPRSITPAIAGLTVGSVVGVIGFLAVMLLVGRGNRRPSRRRAASSPAFTPSTALSARAFAKMGYASDVDEPLSDPMLSVEVEMDEPSAAFACSSSTPAATVSPAVVLSADKSAPHPLGIIKSTSAAMRPAPIADLSFDDSPTEIGETYFDEPPQPRRRTDPPRIRKIAPAGPRFSEPTRNG